MPFPSAIVDVGELTDKLEVHCDEFYRAERPGRNFCKIPSALTMAFLNSGQACAAGTRLLVPKSELDAVKAAIRAEMRAFTVGDPANPKTREEPLASQKQYERVQSYIRKGMEEGAEALDVVNLRNMSLPRRAKP